MNRDDVAAAERMLRPSQDEALAAWRQLVVAERLQVEALPNRPRPEDFYAPVARQFRADPRRAQDPVLDHLLTLTRPDETWLDLGAGGGRYAMAIALKTKRVYAVEPSEGMVSVLQQAMGEDGIDNIDVFPERWPGPSQALVADAGLISQVGYDIEDIGPFLDQLEAHTRRLCVAVLFLHSPTADFAPLWQAVHGERRVLLPGLQELMALLYARGRFPEITRLSLTPRVFASLDELQQAARRPLWLLEGSAEDARLAAAIRELAVPVDGGFRIGPAERLIGVVTWAPK